MIPYLPFGTLRIHSALPDLSGPWHKSGLWGGGEGYEKAGKGNGQVCPQPARAPGEFRFSHLSNGRTMSVQLSETLKGSGGSKRLRRRQPDREDKNHEIPGL